jgi:hypothetical protein
VIGLIDFEDLVVDDILPAVVFEVACHESLLGGHLFYRRDATRIAGSAALAKA